MVLIPDYIQHECNDHEWLQSLIRYVVEVKDVTNYMSQANHDLAVHEQKSIGCWGTTPCSNTYQLRRAQIHSWHTHHCQDL